MLITSYYVSQDFGPRFFYLDAVRLHPSTLTQTLKRLVRRDLIFVSEDPKDSRKKIISITRQGKYTLEQSDVQMKQITADIAGIESELYVIEDCLCSLRHQALEQLKGITN